MFLDAYCPSCGFKYWSMIEQSECPRCQHKYQLEKKERPTSNTDGKSALTKHKGD
jgi:predicted Zn-ribbon and HTH transcriptional regulator